MISKMQIETSGELGNTPPFLSLGIKENKLHRITVTWDDNRSLHDRSVKSGATAAFRKINISVDLTAEVPFKNFHMTELCICYICTACR